MTTATIGRRATDLDRIMPSFQFNEMHSTSVRAAPERVYRAVKEVTAGEIFLFRTLTWLRRLGRPGPRDVLNAPDHLSLLDVVTRTTFLTLADSDREIVVGTVVIRPLGASRARPASTEAFAALSAREGYALAAMNFALAPRPDGGCDLSTETRVYATDGASRRRFAVYWRLINLGSAFIRVMWLRAIKRRAEAGSR
ncbi:MAG TPA: hypothetical protein VGS01_13035 [Candidatus Limnocylindria bacterium]|nr:hypothetical protein [Candidatus Limnocylindria bacterium]